MTKYAIPNLILQNGHWSFTASLGKDATTGRRRQTRKGGYKTKREAAEAYEKLMAEWKAEQAKHQPDAADATRTLGDLVTDYFLPAYKDTVRSQTYRGRVAMIDQHFQALWSAPLSQITSKTILDWRRTCQEKNLSRDYVRKIYGLCDRMFTMAVKMHLIPTNPATVLKDFKVKHDNQRVLHFWTLNEFRKVAASFSHATWQEEWGLSIIDFLFESGLRIGESQILEWGDIDFSNDYVMVNKTIVYHNAHDFYATPPKTKASVRKVGLSDDCLAQLKRWQERQRQHLGECQYVFSTTGIPMNRNAVEKLIRRKAEEVGVPRIRVHDLRHSHASLLIHRKVDPILIRDRLGHSDVKITLGIYGHLYPNRDAEMAQELNGLIPRAMGERSGETPSADKPES
ncbi:MAG: site-specific integrase [Sporolactobacillus sp.]